MKGSSYEKVIVIGYGVIARDVLEIVDKKSAIYGYTTGYIEHEVYSFSVAKKYAEANQIEFSTIEDKKVLLKHFLQELDRYRRVLIISANNNYIFPNDLLDRPGISIINFHNALLPLYPGRNAPTWSIYNNEIKTGITWHYVSGDIDGGDIIIQKEFPLSPDIKAYELVSKQMELAAEAFSDIFENVVIDAAEKIKQNVSENRKVYKSYEVPNDGLISIDADAEEIYRTLRAIDYGKSNIFPLLRVNLGDRIVYIKRYRLVDNARVEDNKIYLPFRNRFLMLVYDIMSDVINTKNI